MHRPEVEIWELDALLPATYRKQLFATIQPVKTDLYFDYRAAVLFTWLSCKLFRNLDKISYIIAGN